jgi:hypothetical protein
MEQERGKIIRFPIERTRQSLEKAGQAKPQEESVEGNPPAPAYGGRKTPVVQPKESTPDRILKNLQEEPPEDADKDKIEALRTAMRGATFFSGVGLGDIPLKHKDKEGQGS